jgi:hypothetical protein
MTAGTALARTILVVITVAIIMRSPPATEEEIDVREDGL